MEPDRPKSKNADSSKRPTSVSKKPAAQPPAPPPKVMTAKAKLEEKKRLQLEQDLKKQEAEQQKRNQVQQARQAQVRKRNQEENNRLQSEMPEHYQRCRKFESAVMNASAQKQISNEWQRYIEDSEMVDINQEKQLSKLIYGMKQIPIGWNNSRLEKWIVYTYKIINSIRNSLSQATATGDTDKEKYFGKNLTDIFGALDGKLEDYVKFVIDGIQHILEVKNKELVEKGLQTLTLQNEKLSDFNRKEDRYKYEIYQPVIESEPFKYGLWINLIKAGFRAKPVAFGDIGFQIQVPRQFLQSTVIISCLRSKFNQFPDDKSQIKCVGDVVQLNIYQMVSLPRITQKFTLKNITDLDSDGKSLLKKHKYEAKQGEMLLGRITLPPVFYVGDTNHIVLANYSLETGWVASKSPVQIDSKNQKSVKFQANSFSVLSLALPKTIDYPYRGFFLRCVSPEEALLDLQTKRIKLQFSIGRNSVKLVTPEKIVPQLRSFYDQQMVSAELLTRLERIGIVVNPSLNDVEQVPNRKSSETEDKVIRDVGFSISCLAFKQSPMNSQSTPQHIVLLAKTHVDFQARDIIDDQYPWEPYLFGPNKCGILNPKLKTYKQEYLPGNTSHISLEKVINDRTADKLEEFEHRKAWAQLYPQFVVTLKGLLKQLRVFSLTV